MQTLPFLIYDLHPYACKLSLSDGGVSPPGQQRPPETRGKASLSERVTIKLRRRTVFAFCQFDVFPCFLSAFLTIRLANS